MLWMYLTTEQNFQNTTGICHKAHKHRAALEGIGRREKVHAELTKAKSFPTTTNELHDQIPRGKPSGPHRAGSYMKTVQAEESKDTLPSSPFLCLFPSRNSLQNGFSSAVPLKQVTDEVYELTCPCVFTRWPLQWLLLQSSRPLCTTVQLFPSSGAQMQAQRGIYIQYILLKISQEVRMLFSIQTKASLAPAAVWRTGAFPKFKRYTAKSSKDHLVQPIDYKGKGRCSVCVYLCIFDSLHGLVCKC